ncbi:MAG: hypothetical protein HQM00_17470 [Magnetococcales bacterium]|nr:hypothetical protein [Magnetococcales bacterium]
MITAKRKISVTSGIRWWNLHVEWPMAVVIFTAMGILVGEISVGGLTRFVMVLDGVSLLVVGYLIWLMVMTPAKRCMPTVMLTAFYTATVFLQQLPNVSMLLLRIASGLFGIAALMLIFTLRKYNALCPRAKDSATCMACLSRMANGKPPVAHE